MRNEPNTKLPGYFVTGTATIKTSLKLCQCIDEYVYEILRA